MTSSSHMVKDLISLNVCRCVCRVSDCPWLEIGVEGFRGELEGWVFSLNLSLSVSLFLSLCHAYIGRERQARIHFYRNTQIHNNYWTTPTARHAHTTCSLPQISLYAHALWARMIKVLCRRDSEWYCTVAACFPWWIQATSSVFSNGEESRHHKCKIRGNYAVICHVKYFFAADMGFPSVQN